MVSSSFLHKAKAEPFFSPFFQDAEEKYRYLRENFADSPDYISGWWHDFNCPDCTATLKADPLVAHHSFTGKNLYTCPVCGKQAAGQALDEAWVFAYRMRLARSLSGAAVFALMGDEDALSHILRLVDFYAETYHRFSIHGTHAGQGKIMAQSLDEAVWLLAILDGLLPIKERIPTETLTLWQKKLFRPMSEFLFSQKDSEEFYRIHNITLWMCSAIGAAALLTEDAEMLHAALDAPFGIRSQVDAGYTADGIWNEGSFHYHYYSTEALTGFLLHYSQTGKADPLFSVLENAYAKPALLFRDGYHIPALNDGWYPITLKKYAPQVLTAAALLKSPALLAQVALLKKRAPEVLPSAQNLLYAGDLLAEELPNPDAARAETACLLLPHTNLALLRPGFLAIFKSGSCRRNHMHADHLSLSISGVSEDLGTPGYAHPLSGAYYQRSLSHNTVCADGRSQPLCYRETQMEPLPQGVRGTAVGLWEGIDAMRELTLAEGALWDRFTLSAKENHRFDWFFHVEGDLLTEVYGEECRLSEQADGYDQLSHLRRIGNAAGCALQFQTELGVFEVKIHSDQTLYIGNTPSNPATDMRTTLLLRTEGENAAFHVSYRLLS